MSAQAVPVVTLDSILAELQQQAPAARRALAADFARAFFARVPVDELELRSPAEWAAIALSNLEFAEQREPGQARVRVFNPPAEAGFGAGYSVVQMVNDDMSFLVDSLGMALAAQGLARTASCTRCSRSSAMPPASWCRWARASPNR
jgi:glutamate dehydrogenase